MWTVVLGYARVVVVVVLVVVGDPFEPLQPHRSSSRYTRVRVYIYSNV